MYETLRNALEAGSRTEPDKVLAGANLALRAETADGGSGQYAGWRRGEFTRNDGWHGGRWTGGWKYHGGDGTAIGSSEQ